MADPKLLQQMMGTQPQQVDLLSALMGQRNQFSPQDLMVPVQKPVPAQKSSTGKKPTITPKKKQEQKAPIPGPGEFDLPGQGSTSGSYVVQNEVIPETKQEIENPPPKAPPAPMPDTDKGDAPYVASMPIVHKWINEFRTKKDEPFEVNPLLAAITGASDILGNTKYLQGYWLPKQAQAEAYRKKAEEEAINDMLKVAEVESGLTAMGLRGKQAADQLGLGYEKLSAEDRARLAKAAADAAAKEKDWENRFKAQAEKDKAAMERLKAQLAAKQGKSRGTTNKVQEAIDKQFGTKTLLEWGAERGKNQLDQQNLDRLMTTIKSNPSWFGRASAFKPDILRDREFINLRDEIEAIAQEGARRAKAMDSQYAAREMDQYLRRKFNPTVSPEDNATRLNQLKKALKVIEQETEKKAQYWDASGGTLKGFKFSEGGSDTAPPENKKKPMSFEEWKKAKGNK